MALLQNLPLQGNSLALAAFQNVQQLRFFGGEVFFGIDSPVDGEPAIFRHHVEIGTAAALSSEHQDRIARLLRAYSRTSAVLLNLAFQRLEPADDAIHAFERVLPLVLQADVRGLPEYLHAHRNRAAVCIPYHTA